MSEWEFIKDYGVLLAAITGLWVRIEVAQALNRQNIRALWARRREDYAALEKKLDQIHQNYNLMRQELRDDMNIIRNAIGAPRQRD